MPPQTTGPGSRAGLDGHDDIRRCAESGVPIFFDAMMGSGAPFRAMVRPILRELFDGEWIEGHTITPNQCGEAITFPPWGVAIAEESA
ncbi:MAG: hypothetical protein ACOYMS_09485 [Terrimicrobiaceae bacterium]